MYSADRECVVTRPEKAYRGKQGLDYFAGISAETVGSEALAMLILTIPPGAEAKAHYHADHETGIYVLSGRGAMWYGPDLRKHLTVEAGDFLYIPPNVPHRPYNPSSDTPYIVIIARTDAKEQESVTLYGQSEGLANREPLD